jgi:DNA polymerase IV
MSALRTILHVDMDAFYASVEQRDDPALRGRAVIVGGRPDSRGVVAACSYEARKFGVHSAMASAQAHRLCPQAVFVRPRMPRYVEVSRQIRALFHELTELVEPLSLDEAYLDVSDNKLGERSPYRLAEHIRAAIRAHTGLTASAGAGPCKLVAKIASDVNKPDGVCVVEPEQVADFLAPLPVTRLWGVGPATARRLSEIGINTVADVRTRSLPALESRLGRYGEMLARLAWGDDPREVQPHRTRKSRGSETTFAVDVRDLSELCETLTHMADELAGELTGSSSRARTVTLKLRYADFKTITRSRTFDEPFDDARTVYRAARELLFGATEAGAKPVRLIGISVSSLSGQGEPEQLVLPFLSRDRSS